MSKLIWHIKLVLRKSLCFFLLAVDGVQFSVLSQYDLQQKIVQVYTLEIAKKIARLCMLVSVSSFYFL